MVHHLAGNGLVGSVGGVGPGKAQLAQAVGAPHPEGTVRLDGGGLAASEGDRHHIVHHLFKGVLGAGLSGGAANDGDGGAAIGLFISQLVIIVEPAGKELAFFVDVSTHLGARHQCGVEGRLVCGQGAAGRKYQPQHQRQDQSGGQNSVSHKTAPFP